jgi:hypothetical protein
MGYADTLLADGEHIVLRTRQHPLAWASSARYGLLLWLLTVVLIVAIPVLNLSGLVRDLFTYGALLALVVGTVIAIWQYLLWWTEEYIVSNRRLLKVTGVVNKRSEDSSLEKINDAVLTVSMWGRIFNYGNLDIMTASEQQVDSYRMLNDAKGFKITMLNEKHNLELELSGGARVPTAPLRAAEPPAAPVAADQPMVPAAAPATVAPPPAAPAAPGDASLEVTQTLARLADLRDRGAISAEEYEAKKTELLGRL